MEKFTGPHNYHNDDYVDDWVEIANTRRPHRARFFELFVSELSRLGEPDVLDLGAGPGFLAEQVLARCAISSYHLLDFSPRMLEHARERLGRFNDRVLFHQVDFLQDRWWQRLPAGFDAVVSLQAVHEVCGADRIYQLYSGVASLVAEGGKLIVADKLDFETEKGPEFVTLEDHERALERAGFREFRLLLEVEDLFMFEATKRGALPGR